MNKELPPTQASEISALLPTLMRQLLAGGDDPAAELPLAQLRACRILYDGPRSMSALSRELRVSLSATTQIANRLVRAGLVSRVAEGNDRRVRCVQLTQQGEKLMRVRENARCSRVLTVLQHLTPDAREEVVVALRMLTDACCATETEGVATSDRVETLQRREINEIEFIGGRAASLKMRT